MSDETISGPRIESMSRHAAEQLQAECPTMIVSITDSAPWGSGERVQFLFKPVSVLHLCFADFHSEHFQFEHEGESLKKWSMDGSHARRIWEFVRSAPSHVERIVVHCEAGVSRSVAIAAALRGEQSCGNPWCHWLMVQARKAVE